MGDFKIGQLIGDLSKWAAGSIGNMEVNQMNAWKKNNR